MNYDYTNGEPFLEVTFPTRGVSTALFRPSDILRVKETKKVDGEFVTEIIIRSTCSTKEKPTTVSYYYDGKLEDFKKNCKRIYL